MITKTHIRNALTGALALMALGLFASCSQDPVAPAEEALGAWAPSASLVQDPVQSCKLVDGVWVCTTTTTTMGSDDPTPDGGPPQCILIGGVLYCEPTGGA